MLLEPMELTVVELMGPGQMEPMELTVVELMGPGQMELTVVTLKTVVPKVPMSMIMRMTLVIPVTLMVLMVAEMVARAT
jgi:hypothetical protein